MDSFYKIIFLRIRCVKFCGRIATIGAERDLRNFKIVFSKIVKGETNIWHVKNRHFKLSKYVSKSYFIGSPPLTFFQIGNLFFFFRQNIVTQRTPGARGPKLEIENRKFYLVKL